MTDAQMEAIWRQARDLLAKMGPIDPRDDVGVVIACRAILAERERCAAIAYRVCAETRHVTLGDAVAATIRDEKYPQY